MNRTFKICAVDLIKPGKACSFTIDGEEIAIINTGLGFHAISNICPHQHTRLVNGADAIIEGEKIVCPMHGWTFEVRTGKPIVGSGRLKVYEIEIKNGAIWAKFDE